MLQNNLLLVLHVAVNYIPTDALSTLGKNCQRVLLSFLENLSVPREDEQAGRRPGVPLWLSDHNANTITLTLITFCTLIEYIHVVYVLITHLVLNGGLTALKKL